MLHGMGHAEISSDAFSTLHWRKWNKSQVLPLAEDITKLQMYLKDQLKICTEQLSISATKKKLRSTAQNYNSHDRFI